MFAGLAAINSQRDVAPPEVRASMSGQKVLPHAGKNKTRRVAAGSKEQAHQGTDVTSATYASYGD